MKKYKEVDKLLKQYVQSTNGDPEKDLSKIDFSKYESQGACAQVAVAKKRMPAYGWAIVATAFVLIIALSVSLPLTLGGKTTPQGSEIYYFEYETVEMEDLDNVTDIKTILGDGVVLSKTQEISYLVWKLIAENRVLGCSFELLIYDEYINDISGSILYDNIELSALSTYKALANTDIWNDVQVHYTKKVDAMALSYKYDIMFNANGFNHYYTINAASEMEIGELMDWVFVEH